MKLNNVKFFIGPMSKNITDTIIDFSITENYKIGIIPSRRQIDWNGGYVNNWTTESFISYLSSYWCDRKNLIVERDHGGIGQGSNYDNGTISYYIDSDKFDIIHIDPWHNYKNDNQRALDETIDNIQFINKINPNCLFEVGTEESIKYLTYTDIDNILGYLKYRLGDLFDKIVYCVIQSGTGIIGTKNYGTFDLDRLKNMVKVCNKYGVLSKEHNGDYLTSEEIKIRFDNGLSAINIAPEFGVFETDILLEYMTEEQKETFYNICYKSNKWVKWIHYDELENKTELTRICGHYQFSDPEFINMNINIDDIIKDRMYNKLKKMTEIWK